MKTRHRTSQDEILSTTDGYGENDEEVRNMLKDLYKNPEVYDIDSGSNASTP